jgi:hypothetical protein
MVGMSGATTDRFALLTPSPLSLPAFTNGTADRILLKYMLIWPAIRSASAGALPL